MLVIVKKLKPVMIQNALRKNSSVLMPHMGLQNWHTDKSGGEKQIEEIIDRYLGNN